MLLPNAERAIIDRAKLEDYLLSFSHPVGRFKAKFFAGLGFSAERWDVLEQAFRAQHLSQDAETAFRTASGSHSSSALSYRDRQADRPWW